MINQFMIDIYNKINTKMIKITRNSTNTAKNLRCFSGEAFYSTLIELINLVNVTIDGIVVLKLLKLSYNIMHHYVTIPVTSSSRL